MCIASRGLLKTGSIQQGQIPCKKALRGHSYETGKVKPKLKWRLKDVGDAGAMGGPALAYTR